MKISQKIFWLFIAVISLYYLYRGVTFRFFTDGNLNQKAFWYILHLFTAIFPLVLGPFQFIPTIRKKYPAFHKRIGKIYLVGSLLGSLSALYLGMTIDLEGSILSITLLAITWLFMVVAAWITARRKNFKSHRLFAIRTYVLALVFIFLRLLGDLPQEKLFFYIKSPEIRDATLEWASWIIPLLILELMITWLPQIRNRTLF
ncbi:MAG: DUF2306 domain-containing protein [Flavobacteriales bacterium]